MVANKWGFVKLGAIHARDGNPMQVDELQYAKLRTISAEYYDFAFQIVYFRDCVVIGSYKSQVDFRPLLEEVRRILGKNMTVCMGELSVEEDQDVQSCYHCIRRSLPVAAKVFLRDWYYSSGQIAFATELLRVQDAMGDQVRQLTGILAPLRTQADWTRTKDTLTSIYLDCEGSLAQAAREMGLHINTLKYRMGRIKEQLALNLDAPINAARLVTALAIVRLTE